ncbi:MAG: response regulator [Armatimonadota bacterium]
MTTIRRRLELSFALILLLFAANLFVYFWSSHQRNATFEKLQRAITRRLELQTVQQEVYELKGQVGVLDNLNPEAGEAGVAPDLLSALEVRLARINTAAGTVAKLAPPEEAPRFEAFTRDCAALADQWRVFFRNVGKRQSVAILALSGEGGADGIVEALLNRTLPEMTAAEEQRMQGARGEREAMEVFTYTVTLLLFVVSIAVAAIVAFLLSSNLVRGLRALESGALAIGAGDYGLQIPSARKDELGRLAREFNAMSSNLAVAQTEVARRTAELEARDGALRQANERLVESEQNALAASRTKSEFLAKMSHELRTPLKAIIGYSEMLQEEAADMGEPAFVTDLERIRSAGKHLLALINDILDLSKIEAGKMEIHLETFLVDAMVRDVVSTVQPLVEKNRNRLAVAVDPASGEMHSDLVKVRQMLFNLLSNASKFTHEGALALRVLRAEREGEAWIVFEVEDSGIGMTEEQMGKLFQDFSQVDSSTSRNYGGTGLGLAITKRFGEMLGGRVHVRSVPGTGSTFTLELPERSRPLSSADDAPAPGSTVPRSAPAEGNGVARSANPRGGVLVIDDDEDMRVLIRRVLTQDGYEVHEAASGEEGLRLASELRPRVITLDVMMPSMDGWSVLSALKSDPVTAAIPVVMLTMVGEREMGFALGAADYLVKPIDREQLTQVVGRFRRATSPHPALVVDDDPATRSLLARILEKVGWSVREAADGRSAMEQVVAQPPDLILLDLVMPGMDGFEFVTELRKHPEYSGVPVVVVTAMTLTHEDRARLHGGVERVLQKGSFTQEELMNEVRRLVRESLPVSDSEARESDEGAGI